MTEEDEKEKIEQLEENLEELKKEYGDTQPDKLFLFIYQKNLPEVEEAGLIFLDEREYTYFYVRDFEIPSFEMGEFQSPSRQAIENLYSLGFDSYEKVEMVGREVREYNDQTKYYFQIEVSEEQTKLPEGNWIRESNLDNYTDANTYYLR
jgi:hypothetical protein